MAGEFDDLAPEELDFHGVTSRYDVPIDANKVPESLRHLIDDAKHWAIGDDDERSKLMTLTPQDELISFVDRVWPLLKEIETWCSQHRDETPVPDEVLIFDMMTNAAAEAVACYVGEPEERS